MSESAAAVAFGSAPWAAFLAPGEYIDSDHASIVQRAQELCADPSDQREAARSIFGFVRDLPYVGDDTSDIEIYRASRVLAVGHGHCVCKAALCAALARAVGIPARIAFADVRNHLASPRVLASMGTDIFAWHGFAELLLSDTWVKASPTFDAEMCRRFGVVPLEFDGVHDALLQSFDNKSSMDYQRFHGSFHDVPARFLAAEIPRLYPQVKEPSYERGVDVLRDPEWLINSGWGTHRAGHRRMASPQLAVRLFRMPGGQRAPWHGSGGWPEMEEPFPPVGADSIYLAVAGEVDFHAGGQEFRMRPLDMLRINAVVYSYFNPGFVDARFWVLNRRGVDWAQQPAAYAGSDMVIWRGDPGASEMVGSHPYYDAEPAPAPDALQRISLVRWEDYRRTPITWSGEWGAVWGAYPFIDVALKARIVRVPAGQLAHRDALAHDVAFIGVADGPLSIDVDGQPYAIGREDVLMIPPGSAFTFSNPGPDEVVLFELWPNLELAAG